MASVTVYQAFSFLAAQDWPWSVTAKTASSIQLDDGTHRMVFGGAFSYDGAGNPSGSVSSMAYRVNGAAVYSITGVSLPVAQMLLFALTAGDTQATYAYVLAGADTVRGSAGSDTLLGYGGNDRIEGNLGNDRVYGGSGNDTLVGGSGNDTLDGGTGSDSMTGGTGNDSYVVGSSTDRTVELAGGGTDTVSASLSWTLAVNLERLTLTGSAAINGFGNSAANVLTGNAAANRLVGGSGNDTLVGGAGNDRLEGGSGSDSMVGGAGNDLYFVNALGDRTVELASGGTDTVVSTIDWTLAGNVERLTLSGSAKIGVGNTLANVITGNAQDNVLSGGSGNDTLIGGGGDWDQLFGGAGNDSLRGSAQDTDMYGGAGNDTFDGSGAGVFSVAVIYFDSPSAVRADLATNTVLDGWGGTDTLVAIDGVGGSHFNDTLIGSAGDDRFLGSLGNDSIVGGAGFDIAYYGIEDGVGAVTVNLATGRSSGAEGNDTLSGMEGVRGSEFGNDVLIGNAGANLLSGAEGRDTLTGAGGADTFLFDASPFDAGHDDRVTDFVSGVDRLQLDVAEFFNIGAEGLLAAGAFRVGTNATDADDRVIYNSTTGQLFFDFDGSGASAQMLFATLNAGTALAASDIWVVDSWI